MRIPTIFHWPTPWLWIGLTVLLVGLVGDSPVLAIAAVIILAATLAHVARGRPGGRVRRPPGTTHRPGSPRGWTGASPRSSGVSPTRRT